MFSWITRALYLLSSSWGNWLFPYCGFDPFPPFLLRGYRNCYKYFSWLRVRKTQKISFTYLDLSLCGPNKGVACCSYQHTCAHYQNQNTNVSVLILRLNKTKIQASFITISELKSVFSRLSFVLWHFLPKPKRAKQWK